MERVGKGSAESERERDNERVFVGERTGEVIRCMRERGRGARGHDYLVGGGYG